MRLIEIFLNETTEEDRAIVSLSSSISNYINNNYSNDSSDEKSYDDYNDDEELDIAGDEDLPDLIGSIGQLFDTPIAVMNPIKLELQSDYGIRQRRKKETDARVIKKPGDEDIMGLWYGGDKLLMVLNKDYLGTPKLKSVIAHELRHALDDFKSDFEANKKGGSYSIPKNKEHRRDYSKDPYATDLQKITPYLAEPAEINARFLQALDKITDQIPALAKYPKDQITLRAQRLLLMALDSYQISYLFPEKEKSKGYKQLLKRGMDYITKELQHVKSQK